MALAVLAPFRLMLSGNVAPVDPSALANYGIAGLVAALVMSALIFVFRRYLADRDKERDELLKLAAEERARADRLEGELAKLNSMIQTQVMSALQESTRAVTDAISKFRREK